MTWLSRITSPLPPRLSSEEAAQVAAQVAELAKAGLPLDAGLRALADEHPGVRVSPTLRKLAALLSAGESLDDAFAAQGHSLPAHVRGLVLAAVRSGNLAAVLEQFVQLQRNRSETRRRLGRALAYPIVLLAMLMMVDLFLAEYLVPIFATMYRDFGATLPALTQAFLQSVTPVVQFLGPTGLLLGVLVLAIVDPAASWAARIVDWTPVIGPLWRCSHLAYFSRLMGLLLAQQVPLPQALRLTAEGLPHSALAMACRQAAKQVEAGQPLSSSLAHQPQFPPTLIPLVEWGERTAAPSEGFRAAAEMFEGRIYHQEIMLSAILVPALYVMILSYLGLFVLAMFLPLISLIQMLT